MSYKVNDTSITLTRGDTFKAKITISKSDGSLYIPQKGDRIRFAMKHDYNDPEPLLLKDIPIDTMLLELLSEDTKSLSFGSYVYDIQLTDAAGNVDTFITKAKLRLTEEVE